MEQRECMLRRCGWGGIPYAVLLVPGLLLLVLLGLVPLYNNARTRLYKSELNLCTKNASHNRSVVVLVVDVIFVVVAMDNMRRPRFSLCLWHIYIYKRNNKKGRKVVGSDESNDDFYLPIILFASQYNSLLTCLLVAILLYSSELQILMHLIYHS